jgi:hypothetical protein
LVVLGLVFVPEKVQQAVARIGVLLLGLLGLLGWWL